MPASKPEPRTLTTREQQQLVESLYQQRLAQDALMATGLNPEQKRLVSAIMLTRFAVHEVLKPHLSHQAVAAIHRRRSAQKAAPKTLVPAQLNSLG